MLRPTNKLRWKACFENDSQQQIKIEASKGVNFELQQYWEYLNYEGYVVSDMGQWKSIEVDDNSVSV